MLVVNNDLLDRLQGPNYELLYLVERIRNSLCSVSRHQKKLQLTQIPLSAELVVIKVGRLLNRNVCEMHVGILDLFYLVRVAVVGETCKACPVEVDRQRLVRCHKAIYAHIELLTPDQKWVHNVTLNNIRLRLWAFWLPSEIVLPLSNLCKLIEEKNSFSLGFAYRLHNPDRTDLAELLNKEAVVARQIIGGRIKMITISSIMSHDVTNYTYAAASSNFPSFSSYFLCRLRFLTIRSFLVSSKWFL